jgi:RhoGEF domain
LTTLAFVCFFLQLPVQAHQNPETSRKRHLIQLINREQHFVSAITFGLERFVNPLRDRKDIISLNDHKTLFQNIDEIVQISEDILEQILQNDHDPQIHFASRVYLSKSMALCAAYKKYCNGLKRADCVLVNHYYYYFN